MPTSFDFLVARDQISRHVCVPGVVNDDTPLASGKALLTVDEFAFTSNNVTYARLGDAMNYWRSWFHPAATSSRPITFRGWTCSRSGRLFRAGLSPKRKRATGPSLAGWPRPTTRCSCAPPAHVPFIE